MKTIELLGHVDEHHRLSALVPGEVPPGPIKLALVVSSDAATEDDAGEQWEAGISREWSDELGDTRQDIYSLSDGVPVDESR